MSVLGKTNMELNQTKALAPQAGVKALTAKNRAFLQHLAAGRPTLEAYSLAGYKGESHAAYQLRSDLKSHLALLLEQGGFSREQLGVEINKLNALPLDENLKNVNFKQKLDILRLMDKALPKVIEGGSKPKVTPFIIGINKPESVTIHEAHSQVADSVGRTDGQDAGVPPVRDMA